MLYYFDKVFIFTTDRRTFYFNHLYKLF